MQPSLIALLVVLTGTFCGWAFVLHEDARRRRVDRQIAVAALDSRMPPKAQERPRRIRLRNGEDERQRKLAYMLLRYDPEAPRSWPESRTVIAGVAAALAAVLLGSMALPLWAALIEGGITGLLVTRGLFGWQQDRYADKLTRQLPDTVQLVVSAVRAGMPVSEAFRSLAREMPEPTREQFGYVVDELALGRPAEEALLGVYRRTWVPEYAIFAVTLSVQSKAGGRLAETLQIMGDTIRERIALAGRAAALAGEAKLSARVLASLPFLAGIALSLERPGYFDQFLHDQRGRLLFSVGIGSLLIGIVTMRRMIKKGTSV